jgi:predicted lipid-binding transport protein (Tim44 family)
MGNPYLAIAIFAVVALFLVIKLRGVLGSRTGTERPMSFGRPDPRPGQRPPQGAPPQGPGATVIDFPPHPQDAAPTAGTGLAAIFAQIRAADPRFNPNEFVQGAAQAFAMIVKAFADGDTAALRRLTSDEVYDTFAEIIRHRLAAHETAHSQILRLDPPIIIGAAMEGRTARLDVKFVSSQLFVLRDPAGEVVEGDPEHALERTDIWSFARNTRALDPNWMLIATGGGE